MDYQKLIDLRNTTNPFTRYVGIEITDISEGSASATMAVSDKHLNPGGSVHGGCLFTLADTVGGAAASSYGRHITTVNSDFHFLRAGLHTSYLTGKAKEIKHGKRLMVFEITIYDDKDALLAEGIFTYMPLDIPLFPQ